jgi:hypothetical protein
MIRIDFNPDQLESSEDRKWWANWSTAAREATDEVISNWEDWKERHDQDPQKAGKFEPKWKSSVWGDLKEWLLKNVFHYKCAYCEIHMPRHYNDAEHHRPKGKVTYADNSHQVVAQSCDEKGRKLSHPGYFWLAYNWKNLLPSCELCNSGKGKQNQFPLVKSNCYAICVRLSASEITKLKSPPIESRMWPGAYFLSVEDLNESEDPLLLHPYLDDPRQHLHFGPKGIEIAVAGSPKALHSIRILQLGHSELQKARQRAQESAFKDYIAACFGGVEISEKVQRAEQEVAKYRRGEEPFSAAACDYIDDFKKTLGK